MRPRGPWAWLLQVINANLALKQYISNVVQEKAGGLTPTSSCIFSIYFLLAFICLSTVYAMCTRWLDFYFAMHKKLTRNAFSLNVYDSFTRQM